MALTTGMPRMRNRMACPVSAHCKFGTAGLQLVMPRTEHCKRSLQGASRQCLWHRGRRRGRPNVSLVGKGGWDFGVDEMQAPEEARSV